MTGAVVIFLALGAGLIVASRRQLVLVIVLPFLVVLGFQTWHISAGLGVSPPSTVNEFPKLISYYVVQVIFLALALGAANQIRVRRVRRAGYAAAPNAGRQTVLALIVNVAFAAAVVSGFLFDRPLFDPGSVVHHSTNGSPPVFGILGGLLCVIVLAGLVLSSRIRDRRARLTASAKPTGGDHTAEVSLEASHPAT